MSYNFNFNGNPNNSNPATFQSVPGQPVPGQAIPGQPNMQGNMPHPHLSTSFGETFVLNPQIQNQLQSQLMNQLEQKDIPPELGEGFVSDITDFFSDILTPADLQKNENIQAQRVAGGAVKCK